MATIGLLAALLRESSRSDATRRASTEPASTEPACPDARFEEFMIDLHAISRAYGAAALEARLAACGGDADGACAAAVQQENNEMQPVYYASLLFQYNRAACPCARRALATNVEATRAWARTVREFGGAVVI